MGGAVNRVTQNTNRRAPLSTAIQQHKGKLTTACTKFHSTERLSGDGPGPDKKDCQLTVPPFRKKGQHWMVPLTH